MFEQMKELFQILNDARRRRGSIDFDLNEAEVIMDDAGVVEAIIALQRNVAHRLIEEFMLLANETVASYLESQEAPSLYRIHETPDILKIAKFEEFISGFGYSLGAPVTALRPRHFQKLLEKSTASRKRSRSLISCCARCRKRATRLRTLGTSALPRRAIRISLRQSAAIPISSCTDRSVAIHGYGNRSKFQKRR